MLVVVEIGVFPLICGWWLDICSLVCVCFFTGKVVDIRLTSGLNVSAVVICDLMMWVVFQEMFDASLKDRELSFKSAPGTTMFLHWLVGMVYVFYFASFILLLREVKMKLHLGTSCFFAMIFTGNS